jgi:UDP-N-acetylglucosamine--N-acetylmuramyl-(pentapeptide) pyrophosphoryl-undecaprenol N-acetylglucosamine transferase
VFSKGGYVSVPVVFAAHRARVPVVLHESDYTPGLANRLCIPRAQKVCLSFESTAQHIPAGKSVVTGSPIRDELYHGSRERGLAHLGFAGDKPVLLIMGGSQGAQAINAAVDQALDALLPAYDIVHIRGEGNLNPSLSARQGYCQLAYVSSELPDVFAAADLMVSRAGSNAIFEILALAIPALLIPLPLEASRGDQILNADFFATQGYSHVLQQADLSPQRLAEEVGRLSAASATLKQAMAASEIANGTQNVIRTLYEVLEQASHDDG